MAKKLTDKIREYIRCPQLDGGTEYGKWGALRKDQRLLINKLCNQCDYFENMLDLELKRKKEFRPIINPAIVPKTIFGFEIEEIISIREILFKHGLVRVCDIDDALRSLKIDKEVYHKGMNTWKKACEMACSDALQVIQSDYMEVSRKELGKAANEEAQNYYRKAQEETKK